MLSNKYFVSCLILLCSAYPIRAEETTEGIAAIVTIKNREPIRHVIFFSDIERYRLFFAPSIEKANLSNQLTEVIHRRLLRPEAKRFILNGPTPDAVDKKFHEIRTRFQNDDAFEQALLQTGLIEAEFKEEIRHHLWIEQLLNERIKEFIFVSPKSIDAYFHEHPELFDGRSLDAVKKRIEAFLKMEKETLKKTEYLKRLKIKADITILMK